ncbi:MAG: DUF861 domain-containing protein [Rubrivivax sp.]|nr:MAG: DUF861 domain-containing protein [Rubrivivax sp.]
MNPIAVIDQTAALTPALDRPRPDRLVAGNPLRKTWVLHEAGPVSSGVWECEVGRWRIVFPATRQEYFHVLAGHVRLHGLAGATDIGPGQGAIIPPGFEGEFEVVEPVRKQFVLIETAS